MAYTLADIRQRVLNDKLADTSFDADIVDGFINDAQRDIFNTYELSFQEKIFRGVLPTGGHIFTFPVDYQQAQSFILAGADGSTRELDNTYVPFREFNKHFPDPENTLAGPPVWWTIYAQKLMFNRPTEQEYTLSLFYLKKPTTLSADGDVPEIPEEFEELLVHGAYYRILYRNEDFDQGNFVKDSEYTPLLDKLVARYGKRQTAKPLTIGMPTQSARRRSARR